MTRTDLEAWLVRRGYAPDRWGHYQKDAYSHIDGQTRRYRWRLSKTHVPRGCALTRLVLARGRCLADGVLSPSRDPATGDFRVRLHAPDGRDADLWLTRDEVVRLVGRLDRLLAATAGETYPCPVGW
jgi:hypothetical protein